jgi:type III pantothenate kinase
MLLTVDIGNTTTDFAVSNKGKIVKIWSIETDDSPQSFKKCGEGILRDIKRRYPEMSQAVICSVVPDALRVIKPLLKKRFVAKISVVGTDIKVPIANRYRDPGQVGQDRLVCAYAAMRLYGSPAIIIDLGTAITFDVVSAGKEYLGGIIVPGLRLSAESLFKKTALLPKVGIKIPRALIGRDTETSILSGLFYGYGVLCQGVIRLIAKQVKKKPKIVMTGGYAESMKKFMADAKPVVDHALAHKGMLLLLERSKKS